MVVLIYEKIVKGIFIFVFDINIICISFIIVLDIMFYFLDFGRYKRILIVFCDVVLRVLNFK